MSGFGHDTDTLRLTVTLPDGSRVRVTGDNDGVNGYEWSATYDRHVGEDVHLPVVVDHEVLIDGITPADEDEDENEVHPEVGDVWACHADCVHPNLDHEADGQPCTDNTGKALFTDAEQRLRERIREGAPEPYGQKAPCPVCDAFGEHQSCTDGDGNLIDDHAERE